MVASPHPDARQLRDRQASAPRGGPESHAPIMRSSAHPRGPVTKGIPMRWNRLLLAVLLGSALLGLVPKPSAAITSRPIDATDPPPQVESGDPDEPNGSPQLIVEFLGWTDIIRQISVMFHRSVGVLSVARTQSSRVQEFAEIPNVRPRH